MTQLLDKMTKIFNVKILNDTYTTLNKFVLLNLYNNKFIYIYIYIIFS